MYVNCNTEFHNVGQGLFYTGHIFDESNDFYFAYDCGTFSTEKYITQEIDTFHHLIRNGAKKLNLLVLSHFDGDHVNQLDKLLNYITVDTVLIPYLEPINRLIMSIKFCTEPDSYYKFLSDPINFFLDKGVKRVIILGDSGPAKDVKLPDELPVLPDDDMIIKLMNDDKLKEKVLKNESIIDEERVFFVNHDGFIFYKNLWLFRFYNHNNSKENLEKFSELIKDQGYDLSSTDKIIEIITDGEKRKNIKGIYRAIWTSVNNTSIIMLHLPYGKGFTADNYISLNSNHLCSINKKYDLHSERCCIDLFSKYGFDTISKVYQKNICTTMLFGDIDLRICHEEIVKHFDGFLHDILIVQVPHHGSKLSWQKEILDEINDNHLSFYVFPFGIHNGYKHPSKEVVRDIYSWPHRKVLPNTECFSVIIESTVTW